MNAHSKPQKNSVKAAPESVTTGPIIGSRKIYVPTPEDGSIRVPFREVQLTTDAEPPVRIYDPSGPFTENDAKIDLDAGLPQPRRAWLDARGFERVAGRAVAAAVSPSSSRTCAESASCALICVATCSASVSSSPRAR